MEVRQKRWPRVAQSETKRQQTFRKSLYPKQKLPSLKSKEEIVCPYTLGQLIGVGASAQVHTAIRREDGQPCVVKIIKVGTELRRKVVLRQVDILKSVSHPRLITILGSHESPGEVQIVMQLFSKESLQSFVKRQRPLPEGIIRRITVQIAEGLQYLHSKNIAHRDLKPENVLVNANGDIKLIDLGLATTCNLKKVSFAGTPQFMCPELMQKKSYDPIKADMWALGILLYWVVLGYYPQQNDDQPKGRPAAHFKLLFPCDMHPGIQYLIQQLLESNPEARVSARDVLHNTWLCPVDFKSAIQRLSLKCD